MRAPEFSRREVLKGGLSAVVLPHLGSGLTRPYQSSFDHLAFHREIAAVYADNPHLTRQHSSPEIVYINEKCGESIRITGVCPKTNVVEMIWVLAPADGTAIAGIPFEHRHLNQDEIFHPLEGEVLAVIEDVPQSYGAGEHFTVKAGQNHVGWNASRDPLAVRVEYTPAMDGELALMYYWGLVSQAEWTDEAGRPKLAALGALNHGLETAALPSKVSEMAGRFSAPFMSLLARRERIELMREEILAHRVGWLL